MFIKYCIFRKFYIYIPDSGRSRFPAFVHRRHNGSAAAELAEFRKITTFSGKTQYLMNIRIRSVFRRQQFQDKLAKIIQKNYLTVIKINLNDYIQKSRTKKIDFCNFPKIDLDR